MDGIDIRDMRMKDLRKNISIVGQVLFHDTILQQHTFRKSKCDKRKGYPHAVKEGLCPWASSQNFRIAIDTR